MPDRSVSEEALAKLSESSQAQEYLLRLPGDIQETPGKLSGTDSQDTLRLSGSPQKSMMQL